MLLLEYCTPWFYDSLDISHSEGRSYLEAEHFLFSTLLIPAGLSHQWFHKMFLICLSTIMIILLWGTEVLDNFGCYLSYSPAYTSTPGGGTALLSKTPRHGLNSHQFQPTVANTSICKGGFVWSLTFPSWPLTGSNLSLKSHCSCCLAWSMLKPVTSVLFGSLSGTQRDISQVQEKCLGQAHPVCCLLGEQVGVVVVVGEFVKERAWLQDEGGQHHPGQVHARPQLLQQDPHQALVLLRDGFCLRWLPCLQRERAL